MLVPDMRTIHPFVSRLRRVDFAGRVSGLVTLAGREFHFAALSKGGRIVWEVEVGRLGRPVWAALRAQGYSLRWGQCPYFASATEAETFCVALEGALRVPDYTYRRRR